jgi:predicted small lipoprotein YifL
MKAEVLLLALAFCLAACGVKGPPKPPLHSGGAADTTTSTKAMR